MSSLLKTSRPRQGLYSDGRRIHYYRMGRAEFVAVKVKAFPVQALTGLECSRRWRLPDSVIVDEGDKVVSPTHQPSLPVRRYSRYFLLLGARGGAFR
jgi:hypothetical protein